MKVIYLLIVSAVVAGGDEETWVRVSDDDLVQVIRN